MCQARPGLVLPRRILCYRVAYCATATYSASASPIHIQPTPARSGEKSFRERAIRTRERKAVTELAFARKDLELAQHFKP